MKTSPGQGCQVRQRIVQAFWEPLNEQGFNISLALRNIIQVGLSVDNRCGWLWAQIKHGRWLEERLRD